MTTTTNLTAALTLVSVLNLEGAFATLVNTGKSYRIVTNACQAKLMACVSTANTLAGAR